MKEVINSGHIVNMQDFMEGKLPCLPGEFPTLNDWENHLTEIYPEVCFLHLRSPFSEIFCFQMLLPNA